jgi:hypothetical protein
MWKPITLPTGPIARQDSDKEGDCPDCGAPDGQTRKTTFCGTWDYDADGE